MKKLFLFLSLIALLSSCEKTPQQKAENLVKDYLKQNLKDPSSYESVSFDTLQILTNAKQSPEGIRILNIIDSLTSIKNTIEAKIKENESGEKTLESIDKWAELTKQTRVIDEQIFALNIDSLNLKHLTTLPSFKRIVHTYRAKNSFGALDVNKTVFVLDSAITSISSTGKAD